jgi:hypothetical protein
MTNNQLFAAALGITAPWFVETVDFDAGQRRLPSTSILRRAAALPPKAPGEHPVHDTQVQLRRWPDPSCRCLGQDTGSGAAEVCPFGGNLLATSA